MPFTQPARQLGLMIDMKGQGIILGSTVTDVATQPEYGRLCDAIADNYGSTFRTQDPVRLLVNVTCHSVRAPTDAIAVMPPLPWADAEPAAERA